MIEKTLEKLGLSSNEAKTYLVLVEHGSQAVGPLSKNSGINRTTLYGVLKSLTLKGFVTSHFNELEIAIYEAITPKRLLSLIEKKEVEILEAKKNIRDIMPQLESIYKGPTSIPRVKFFEGQEGIKALYTDSIQNNKEKTILAITDYEAAYSAFPEFFEEYFKQRVKNHVKVLNILPDSKKGRKDLKRAKALLREMRFIPLVEKLEIEINIYDDKVGIISFAPDQVHGVLIQSEVIAQAMQNIFYYIWKK